LLSSHLINRLLFSFGYFDISVCTVMNSNLEWTQVFRPATLSACSLSQPGPGYLVCLTLSGLWTFAFTDINVTQNSRSLAFWGLQCLPRINFLTVRLLWSFQFLETLTTHENSVRKDIFFLMLKDTYFWMLCEHVFLQKRSPNCVIEKSCWIDSSTHMYMHVHIHTYVLMCAYTFICSTHTYELYLLA
jgi:hypothetical protein